MSIQGALDRFRGMSTEGMTEGLTHRVEHVLAFGLSSKMHDEIAALLITISQQTGGVIKIEDKPEVATFLDNFLKEMYKTVKQAEETTGCVSIWEE